MTPPGPGDVIDQLDVTCKHSIGHWRRGSKLSCRRCRALQERDHETQGAAWPGASGEGHALTVMRAPQRCAFWKISDLEDLTRTRVIRQNRNPGCRPVVANDRKSEGIGRKPDTERRENGFPSFAVLRPTFLIGKTSIFAYRISQVAE